jgi:hypothetical protein
MQMIRENYDRIDAELMPLASIPKRGTQQIDLLREQARTAIVQIDRKEIASAWNEVASVAGHVVTIRLWIDPGYRTLRLDAMGFAALNPSTPAMEARGGRMG